MAAATGTGSIQIYNSGQPFQGVLPSSFVPGAIQNYYNGQPYQFVSGISISSGGFFFMFS
jgi:hypothetical protein